MEKQMNDELYQLDSSNPQCPLKPVKYFIVRWANLPTGSNNVLLRKITQMSWSHSESYQDLSEVEFTVCAVSKEAALQEAIDAILCHVRTWHLDENRLQYCLLYCRTFSSARETLADLKPLITEIKHGAMFRHKTAFY